MAQRLEFEWVRSHVPDEVTERSYARMQDRNAQVVRAGRLPAISRAAHSEERWYAVWTCSRHEKAVTERLNGRKIEAYLPMYTTVRRWKNGDHRVDLPLFPGYAFVRILLRNQMQVLKVAGVVRLVGFNGAPTPLPNEEVESLRQALSEGIKAQPHPFLTVGKRARITSGPFTGCEGVLVRKKNALRVVLSIELIQRSMALDIDAAAVEPANC